MHHGKTLTPPLRCDGGFLPSAGAKPNELIAKQVHMIGFFSFIHKYMLFTGREVRMGKNCARGLEYGPRPKAEGRTQDEGHSFFPYGPT